jgi:enoyl-CoA hydratase/carnithine racemase
VIERAYEKIKVTRDGGVVTLTLSNPARRNAIGPRMTNELLYALEDARAAADVRVIVLTGEGKAFCSGGDFAEMTSGATESTLSHKGDYADLLLAMSRTDKPIVARVNGVAMGGGLGLVAASTFAIAASDVKLGTPEIDVGLFPMMIMAVLIRFVPRRRLVQMMLLGEKLSADEALRLGLLNEVTPPDELDAAVKRTVDTIVSKSPSTIALGMRAYVEQDGLDLAEALPILRTKLAEVLATNDAREGLIAFLEKRPPKWTGT